MQNPKVGNGNRARPARAAAVCLLSAAAVLLAAGGAAARRPASEGVPAAAPPKKSASPLIDAQGPADGHPAPEAGSPPAAAFERADAKTIKAAADEILSDPRFIRRQSLIEWLIEKLANWRGPSINWGSAWALPVLYLLIAACVLTLLAILAHLAWTIWTLVGAGRRRRPAAGRQHFLLFGPDASFEELDALRMRLAGEGRFREAIGLTMAALLVWLEGRGVLRFHQSKTNGDYVREFPASRPGREEFRRFVHVFDGTIYGGATCGGEVYRRFSVLFERVRAYVGQGS